MANSNHGFVRGAQLSRQSRLFEGRFGRMFRSTPEFDLDINDPDILKQLEKLSEDVTAKPEADGPTHETKIDGEENNNIEAGYTYLGQFIDHDLTFDPASSLQRLNDPEALTDFRTPRFDLDSIYGRGPDDQPYMYDMGQGKGRKFRLGGNIGVPEGSSHLDTGAVDHLRVENDSGPSRAIIGDKRNDENVIVAQIHTIFLRFHNRMADNHPGWSFEEVQQAVRWHYQWVVLRDYLVKIVGKKLVWEILPHLASVDGNIHVNTPKLQFYKWEHDPYIPTEFSVAAFRFGHSMVRPVYRLNREFENLDADPIKEQDHQGKISAGIGRRMLFDMSKPKEHLGLNGFDKIQKGWAIEWDLFFKMKSSGRDLTKGRTQPSYKVDTSLVNPLANLPEMKGRTPNNRRLAFLNIMRGFSMRLPSGEDVARTMSIEPLEEKWLKIGKAESDESWNSAINLGSYHVNGKPIFKIDLKTKDANGKPVLGGRTPLWIYILAEGAKNSLEGVAHAMGPVGGRIIAETFIGMILGDTHSYLKLNPLWVPNVEMGGEDFNFARFIQFAMGDKVTG